MTIIFRALLLGFFIAFIGLAGCQSEAVPSADLILYNAKVYAVDEEEPWAKAVAIKDTQIVYVGSNKDIQNWFDSNTTLTEKCCFSVLSIRMPILLWAAPMLEAYY